MKRLLIVVAAVLAFSVVSFWTGLGIGKKRAETATKTDTTTVVKYVSSGWTFPKENVRFIDSPVLIPFEETRTVTENDTVYRYAVLPKEVKEYGDSTYYARISGVNPELEEIKIFSTENVKLISSQEQKPDDRWKRKDYFYTDASFLYDRNPLLPVTAGFGYSFGPLDLSAGAGYDFISREPVLKATMRLTFGLKNRQ